MYLSGFDNKLFTDFTLLLVHYDSSICVQYFVDMFVIQLD